MALTPLTNHNPHLARSTETLATVMPNHMVLQHGILDSSSTVPTTSRASTVPAQTANPMTNVTHPTSSTANQVSSTMTTSDNNGSPHQQSRSVTKKKSKPKTNQKKRKVEPKIPSSSPSSSLSMEPKKAKTNQTVQGNTSQWKMSGGTGLQIFSSSFSIFRWMCIEEEKLKQIFEGEKRTCRLATVQKIMIALNTQTQM